MSGFEVAGIALAILPLLISTAERYDDCFHPLTRYRKFAPEVSRFQQQLKIQKIIFRNQCRILLEFVIDRDDVARTLSAPQHSSPSNSDVETRLAEQFGESKEACGTIVSLIDERLRDIEKESQDLEAAVNQDQTVPSLLSKAEVLLANDSLPCALDRILWRQRMATPSQKETSIQLLQVSPGAKHYLPQIVQRRLQIAE